jgi:hypothetical protein
MKKLRQYIREYVMYLYKAKMEDGDEDFQYKFTSDVLPVTYNRRYNGISAKGRY